MKSRQHSPKRKLITVSLVLAAAMMLLAQTHNVSAQWTSGTNISNTNSGNVGIGTAAPTQKLEVVGDAKTKLAESGNSGGIQIGTEASERPRVGFHVSDNSRRAKIELNDVNGFTERLGLFMTDHAGHLEREYLSVLYNGNVGIGTTTPQGNLDVAAVNPTLNVAGTNHASLNVIRGTTSSYANIRLGTGSTAEYTEDWSIQTRADADNGNQFSITRAGTNISTFVINKSNGYVGIGNRAPTAPLDVTGNINASGTITGNNIVAKYQDVAEWVPAAEKLSAGTVVVLDSNKSNQVIPSTEAYDTRVAGVISEQPGIVLGESGSNKVLVATTGRVIVKVDASLGPIHIGDLLVTSDIRGLAMKSEPVNLGGVRLHRPGTLIGKALEPLEKGPGKILVLLSLQ